MKKIIHNNKMLLSSKKLSTLKLIFTSALRPQCISFFRVDKSSCPIIVYCYIVASVLLCSIYLCTSFEKNEFENFSILILMPYLSQTFESYQRVRIYTYSVNDLGLKKFYSNLELMNILHFADRTFCPKIAFCVQCYSVLQVH